MKMRLNNVIYDEFSATLNFSGGFKLVLTRDEVREMSPRARQEDMNYWKCGNEYVIKIIAVDEINELREDMAAQLV